MDWLEVPFVTFIVVGGFYLLFDLIIRRGERKMLIEKIVNLKEVDVNKLLSPNVFASGSALNGHKTSRSLSIALTAVGIGVGLLIGELANISVESFGYAGWGRYSVLMTASVCIFGGLGLLAAVLVTKKEEKESKRQAEKQ